MLRVSEMEDVQVVGIADPVLASAEAAVAEVGGSAYADHREMLEKTKPDAVWVSSPCYLHAEHTISAAQAGAHVMCEKPMALSLEDCDRMLAATRAAGVKLMIGHSTRYNAPLVEVKRILESGQCGRLINAYSTRMSAFNRPDDPWRLDGNKSGGTIFELHIHEIDFVCSLGGRPKAVYARTAYSRDDAPSFMDNFSALFTFDDGAYATIEASWSCTVGGTTRGFVASKGSAQAQGADGVRLKTTDMDEAETVTAHATPALDAACGEGIRNNTPTTIPGEAGRANVELGLAIIESGRTGEVVRLPSG